MTREQQLHDANLKLIAVGERYRRAWAVSFVGAIAFGLVLGGLFL